MGAIWAVALLVQNCCLTNVLDFSSTHGEKKYDEVMKFFIDSSKIEGLLDEYLDDFSPTLHSKG